MNLKKIALAVAAGSTLLVAAPAFAQPPYWAPAHGWRAKHHQPQYYYRAPAYAYYPTAPVYVPPPVVYYPRPVIYGHIPVNPNLQIRFGFRL